MCGIVGYIGKNKTSIAVLIDGLKRLEYRGYDSAGIAYLKENNIEIYKEKGRLENLERVINLDDKSNIGIGHTRWATHGKADKINAHPHNCGKFTIVHNGIIENYISLKEDLISKGYKFKSETDTEVVSVLLDDLYKSEKDILKCLNNLSKLLKGTYALGIICIDESEKLYVLKNKSPLIIGIGKDINYIASDVPAIIDKTKKYIDLNDNDYAVITYDSVTVYNDLKIVKKEVKEFLYDVSAIDKQGYDHFMLKEIHEEPDVFKRMINEYFKNEFKTLDEKLPDMKKYSRVRIVACGSAMHAGLVGKYLLEKYADIETNVEIASEFRYNKCFLKKDELVILISQSGETADTLAALEIAKEHGCDTLGIINEKGSTIARNAKTVLYTEAGKEIAVATTKAYFAQVLMFSFITASVLNNKKDINELEIFLRDVKALPIYIEELLNDKETYLSIAKKLKEHNDIFFIGRGIDYALSMEGSLKLKEISYTHSEAYAAGELKHGTISLVEKGTPVISIVTDKSIASKTISNIKEVKARGAFVIYLVNDEYSSDEFYDIKIKLPKVSNLLMPLLTVIPLQLISYEVAKLKKCDIDKPRNLAKSVTVE